MLAGFDGVEAQPDSSSKEAITTEYENKSDLRCKTFMSGYCVEVAKRHRNVTQLHWVFIFERDSLGRIRRLVLRLLLFDRFSGS